MSIPRKLFLLLGSTYCLICRVPAVGEPALRGFCRALGYLGNLVPGGMKWKGSMTELKQDLEKAVEEVGPGAYVKVDGYDLPGSTEYLLC